MSRWADMSPAHEARLRRMSDGLRDRVLERAAILHADGKLTWAVCDVRALVMETAADDQRGLPGVES